MARVKRTYYFIFQTITAGMAENTKDDIVEMSRLDVYYYIYTLYYITISIMQTSDKNKEK